jgi:predicted dienelactone hydrolase
VFSIPGLARRNAPAASGHFPVVVISHGYSNDPAMLSWLGENLATKGYVAVAIAHRDPPITDRSKAPALVLQRPLDIVAVVRRIRGGLLGPIADPSRIALVGYSMGGMGVLAAAGGTIDPAGPPSQFLPPALIARYGAGGPGVAEMQASGIRAVVAITPFGGAPYQVFGKSLAGVQAPLLVLAGTADRTVGYEGGPAALFASATGSDRYLLTFENAGHSIGTVPAPAEMRSRLWDFSWFEDPIWRKARINAISLHFITAFLDLQLKGDAGRLAYLTVPSETSDKAGWTGPATPYAAVSEGGSNPTWKGFVRDHQDGLILRHLTPGAAAESR